jgi:hypothetical protein
MNKNDLLDNCLAILHSIKDDKKSLETLLKFMEEKFLPETEAAIPLTDYKQQIDAKYRPAVKDIAEYLGMNHIVFVNPETLGIESAPKDYDSFPEFDFDDNKVMDWIRIEPLESHKSYEIIKSFVENLPVGKEKDKLTNAIEGYKPFANFNRLIHDSEERENWFKYRTLWYEKFVIDNYLTNIIKSLCNKN